LKSRGVITFVSVVATGIREYGSADAGPHEHPATPGLREIVRTFWSLAPAHRPPSEGKLVLPDGCVDVVFRFTDSHVEAFVAGVTSSPRPVEAAVGDSLFGVSFGPGEASAVLGAAMSECRDRAILLEHVVGPQAKDLGWRIAEMQTMDARTAVLERWLQSRLADARATRRPDLSLRRLVRAIECENGNVTVKALASQAGLSERQLERRFLERVGIGPKLLARIVRLRATFRAAAAGRDGPNWAELAARYGYSDQAHLVHEFSRLAGSTPGRLEMSNFYNT
jgi:AraC-like DNA-binding protein